MSAVGIVNEIFVSIQGEGPGIGIPSVFVRLAGCNLDCTWCDTKYAKSHEESKTMTAKDVIGVITDEVGDVKPYYDIVITGGEPMLQHELVNELCKLIGSKCVTIETNGTVSAKKLGRSIVSRCVKHIVVSPKLQFMNAKYLTSLRSYVELELELYDNKVYFKYVHEPGGISDILRNIRETGVPHSNVFLMSLGADSDSLSEVDKSTIEMCKSYGFRWTPRAHIYVYGNRRRV